MHPIAPGGAPTDVPPSLSLWCSRAILALAASTPAPPARAGAYVTPDGSGQGQDGAQDPEGEVLLFELARGRGRTLEADYAVPQAVALAYTDTWAPTLLAVMDLVTPATEVVVLLDETGDSASVRELVAQLRPEQKAQIRVTPLVTDSPWVRDFGPLQTRESDGALRWLDAYYSGERPRDEDVPLLLAEELGQTRAPEEFPWPLDGGALSSNGTGVCVSTTHYFRDNDLLQTLDRNSRLLSALGCRQMLLLPALTDEPTQHVDMFLQFVGPRHAVLASFDPTTAPEDARRTDLSEVALRSAFHRWGQELTVSRIPVSTPLSTQYRAYVNAVQLGELVLVPTYGYGLDDEAALSAWRGALPQHSIIGVPAADMLDYEGALHCAVLGLQPARRTKPARRIQPRVFPRVHGEVPLGRGGGAS